jgi:hypothetical protein
MDADLIVAIIAAMLNIVLSLLLPSLLKNSNLPFGTQIKKNYECTRDVIMVSSVLTIIFVYVSLKITPFVRSNFFTNLAKLNVSK